MEIKSYAYTSRGRLPKNEDAYGFSDIDGIWAVADGLSGYENSETAARGAVRYFMNEAKKHVSFSQEEILRILHGANRDLFRGHKRTTVAATFRAGDMMRFIHAGDTRFYYFKNNRLYAQSLDHSAAQMAAYLGEISSEQIRFYENRDRLLLLLGEEENLNISEIDGEILLENGDAFLICTDGFWNLIFETEMEIDLLKAETPQVWIDFMVARILHRLEENSGNFTVIGGFAS